MSEFYNIILNKKSDNKNNSNKNIVNKDKKKANKLFKVNKKKLKLITNKNKKILDPKYENQATNKVNNDINNEDLNYNQFRENQAYDAGGVYARKDLIDPGYDNEINRLKANIEKYQKQLTDGKDEYGNIYLKNKLINIKGQITKSNNRINKLEKEREELIYNQNKQNLNIQLTNKRSKSQKK